MFAVSVLTPRLRAANTASSEQTVSIAALASRGRATTARAHAASQAPSRCCAIALAPCLQRRSAGAEQARRGQCARGAVENAASNAITLRQRQQGVPLPRIYDRAHGRRHAPIAALVDPGL